MKSFKELFTSKSKTHSPESSFKIGGMGSLKVLDVIPSPEEDSDKLKKAFQGFLCVSILFHFIFLLFIENLRKFYDFVITEIVVVGVIGKLFIGLGTDEEGIIEILGHRDASQRKKIRETYQQLYNESLIDVINSELSGDFRVCSLLCSYFYFHGKFLTVHSDIVV